MKASGTIATTTTRLRPHHGLLARYLKAHWPNAAMLGVLLFTNIGVRLVNPLLVRDFIDEAIAKAPLRTLLALGGAFTVLAVLQQILRACEAYVGENLGWSATNDMRADLALHCFRLDMPFHAQHNPGELVERIDGDSSELANFFSRFTLLVVGNTLFILGALIILTAIEWRLGVVLTGFTVLVALVLTRIRTRAVDHWKAARQASADLFGFIEERLTGIEDIKSAGAVNYVTHRLSRLMATLLHRFRGARLRGNAIFLTTSSSVMLGQGIALALGAYLFFRGATSLGTVFLAYLYTQLLYVPLDELTRQLQDFQRASASIARVTQLWALPRHVHDGPGLMLNGGGLSVDFEHVAFGYEAGEAVLRDVSFDLPLGKVLGLLGRTGSGKTTIVRLLLRLYDPNEGVIRLGSCDIRQARISQLRRAVAVVTQDVQLFRASVRDNLTFFADDVPDEQILSVLRAIGLWPWYLRLPLGLDTVLESRGADLSAGEAQLLALTRAFLRTPNVVVLDEASSRLDPLTARTVRRSVNRLLQGRTGIIIAHHLPTVMRTDRILILEDGRVREFGPTAQLARDPSSRFHALLRSGLEEVLA